MRVPNDTLVGMGYAAQASRRFLINVDADSPVAPSINFPSRWLPCVTEPYLGGRFPAPFSTQHSPPRGIIVIKTFKFFSVTCALAAAIGISSDAYAGAATTECTAVANNLLTTRNCAFDSDTSGWGPLATDSLSHEAGDGSPSSGSGRASDTLPGTQVGVTSDCYPLPAVSQGALTDLAVDVKGVGIDPDPGCGITVLQYDGANCTGTEDSSIAIGGSGAGNNGIWRTYSGQATLEADTVSFKVSAGCTHTTANPEILLDNIVMAPATVPVELQSFDVQ